MTRLKIGAPLRKPRGLNIAAIPNCEWWIDCAKSETITFAGGTNVSQIADLSGKNQHLTKTGAGNETTYPVYSAAERGITFGTSAQDQMIAGAIGDWNFLHNGNGCSVLLLLKISAAQAANGAIFSTTSEAGSGIGTNIIYYNTNQNYHISTRNGSGLPFFSDGATNALQKNTSVILSMHMEFRTGNPMDLVTRYNGATDLRTANLTTLSAANSTHPLTIGRLASGTSKCGFTLKKAAVFSRRLSKAEENLILEEWARSENISLTRYPEQYIAVIAGHNNAKGHGAMSDTEFASTPAVSNAYIFNSTAFTWAALNAGTNNDAYNSSSLGIEMKLAQQFTTLSGKNLYIVKYAVDGTPMASWDSGNANFTTLQTAMRRAVWNLEDAGHAVKPFFIWYQGEADALNGTLADNYNTALQTFLTQILATPGYPQCPTYLVQTHMTPTAIGLDRVRAAQLQTSMTVPFSTYTRLIETDDIADHLDQTHMKAAALNAVGTRIAKRFLKIPE